MDQEKKDAMANFLKQAFRVNGAVEFVPAGEARELLKGASVSLIRFNDFRRGIFYIAMVEPVGKSLSAEETIEIGKQHLTEKDNGGKIEPESN